MNRKTLAISVGSAILGGLGVGYVTLGPTANAERAAIVEDQPTDSTTDTATPPADATDPEARMQERLGEVLAPLVSDGTITQAQADKVIAALVAARPERGPGDGRGPRGPRVALDVAATALGLTEDQVRTELRSGKTLAEIATANNVDPQKVIDAIVLDATQRIDQKVAAGDLTADQATKIKSGLVERVTTMVNEGGKMGGGRHGGPHGPMGDRDGDDSTSGS